MLCYINNVIYAKYLEHKKVLHHYLTSNRLTLDTQFMFCTDDDYFVNFV